MPGILEKASLPVIISGTGPAALLLAHTLLRASPPLPFRIYERDQSMHHRAQGYRFVVKGSGVRACLDNLSPEHYTLLRNSSADNPTAIPKKIKADTGESLPQKMFVPGNKKMYDEEQPLKVDRTVLRQVLFKGLEGYTTFGKEIVGYEEPAAKESQDAEQSSFTVRFADGSTTEGSLLVAADGSFSRVRQQLVPDFKVLDSELRMVFGKTFLTPEFYAAIGAKGRDDPAAASFLEALCLLIDPTPRNSPMFFMYEPMIFSRRDAVASTDPQIAADIPEDYIYWGLALRSDEPEPASRDWRALPQDEAAALCEELSRNWKPELQAILSYQDRSQSMPLRSPIMSLPIPDFRKGANPMVTLVGDAAHAMPPTGGVGATFALTDAANLGKALIEHGITRKALEVYETEMRGYAEKGIAGSVTTGKMLMNMREQDEMKPMH